jgi:putative glycosyltransferase (TIGR04348 family)
MNILIVTPEPPGGTLGNSVTAGRWTKILGHLGHRVSTAREWAGEEYDLLVALHARRSHGAIQQFRRAYPKKPLIVALTGTDLYRDLPESTEARHSLSLATRIVVLQDAARQVLDAEACSKTAVIYQAAEPPAHREASLPHCFEVCVLSHLRDVKDPLRAAYAARSLPDYSRILVTHAGTAMDVQWEDSARAEERVNPRYRWIGEQSHEAAMQLLARSRLLVLSSVMEGGANAIAEAVVCGVPVLCSDIAGNAGMLGSGYPGYFRLKDTGQLASLLVRAETDETFLELLQEFILKLQPRFAPGQEMESWNRLLQEL